MIDMTYQKASFSIDLGFKTTDLIVGINSCKNVVLVEKSDEIIDLCIYGIEAVDVGRMVLNAYEGVHQYNGLMLIEDDHGVQDDLDDEKAALDELLNQDNGNYTVSVEGLDQDNGNPVLVVQDEEDLVSIRLSLDVAPEVASAIISLGIGLMKSNHSVAS